MKTKLSLILIMVLLLSSLGGCKKIAKIIGCTAPLGGSNLPFIATYPDHSTYRGRTDDQGTAHYPSRGFDCRNIGLRHGLTFGFSLTADPSSIYLPAPPSSGMVYGQGMSGTYGPALAEYFDSNGYYIGETTSWWVSGDGTSLQAPFPDLSSVYSGSYRIRITNMTWDGYYIEEVGDAYGSGWGRDRLDSDGDGWFDDEDCYPYDPTLWDCYQPPPDPCGTSSPGNPYMEQPAMPCNVY